MPDPSSPLPANVLDALQRGNTIEAIKLLRESTGLGLKEAKDAIDGHLRGTGQSADAGASEGILHPSVMAALQRGKKIEAIRLLRKQTGLGMKEAKDTIDAYQRETRTLSGKLAPGEVPRSGKGAWLFVLLVVAALVGYYFLGGAG